jgi:hypothetical protein
MMTRLSPEKKRGHERQQNDNCCEESVFPVSSDQKEDQPDHEQCLQERRED